MSVDTMARLYELKNIIGVKDATGDLNRVNQTLKKLGKDFIQLTGNDDNAFEFNKKRWSRSNKCYSKYCAKTLFRFSKIFSVKK